MRGPPAARSPIGLIPAAQPRFPWRPAAGALLIVVALIVYGSLYPWQFAPLSGSKDLRILLRACSESASDPSDIFVNIFLYIPVGLFAFLALDRRGFRSLRWILPVLCGLLLSGSMELLQIFDRSRVCSFLDLFDNTLGAAIGTGLGWMFRSSMSGAFLLVLYWLGYALCGIFDALEKRRVTAGVYGAPLQLVTFVSAWAVVAVLLWRPLGVARRTTLAILLAAAFTGLLIVRGLAPFHWKAHPGHFFWLPFGAMLGSGWIAGLPVFLQKSFLYGSAIWLWRKAGLRFVPATAIVAAILAAIEGVQLWLPGRTSESTDPLLAILLGLLLWLLELDQVSIVMIREQSAK